MHGRLNNYEKLSITINQQLIIISLRRWPGTVVCTRIRGCYRQHCTVDFKICWSDSSRFSFNPQHNTNEYQYKQLKTDRASSLQQMTLNPKWLCLHQKFCRHVEEKQHVTSEQSFFSMHLCSTQPIWHAPCLLAAYFPQ